MVVWVEFVVQSIVWLTFCAFVWAVMKHGDLLSDGNVGSDTLLGSVGNKQK